MCPDTAVGAYSASENHICGGEGLAAPSQELHPPFRPLASEAYSTISCDAVADH